MAQYKTKHQGAIDSIQNDALLIFGKYDLHLSMIWMAEEFGEVFQAIRKEKSKEEITGEFGDLLAWIFCLANILNIRVEDAINYTFSKEISRQLSVYGKMKYCDEKNVELHN